MLDVESKNSPIPRILWTFWQQGWDQAPELVRACLRTWRDRNPGWTIRALSQADLPEVLAPEDLQEVEGKAIEPEAFSDVVRLALLRRYGGVWADATLYCLKPLDAWLPEAAAGGFFAFDRPGPNRMISSWFLASAKGGGIVQQWSDRARNYWRGRTQRHHYFWVHYLFAECYEADEHFRRSWDAVTKLSADGPHRYLPYEVHLPRLVTPEDESVLNSAPIPVLKLTHKIDQGCPARGSVMQRLIDHAIRPHQIDLPRAERVVGPPEGRELLVAWYGAFDGHGTIGDLLAMQSVVTHLVGRGHRVSHASADQIRIPGADRVDWAEVDPARYDGVMFVCGPILRTHPLTQALFERFAGRRILGVGVSMFPPDHFNYVNPFHHVLAREGKPDRFEDVAVVAPLPSEAREIDRRQSSKTPVTIGVVLRGPQSEYGDDICLWKETQDLVGIACGALLVERGGEVVVIENHLRRAGVLPSTIEATYRRCDLVLTSRYHGAMLSVRHDVPFIAIDHIRGGAKVDSLLSWTGWPHRFRADQTDHHSILQAATALLRGERRRELRELRDQAILRANATLSHLDEWIGRLD